MIDFGSALLFDPAQGPPMCDRFYGTSSSAPPEVLHRLSYDPCSAEIWSLAVLLHILLTGSTPFPNLDAAVRGERMKVEGIQLGPEVDEVLDGCLCVDVEKRWGLDQLLDCRWVKQM